MGLIVETSGALELQQNLTDATACDSMERVTGFWIYQVLCDANITSVEEFDEREMKSLIALFQTTSDISSDDVLKNFFPSNKQDRVPYFGNSSPSRAILDLGMRTQQMVSDKRPTFDGRYNVKYKTLDVKAVETKTLKAIKDSLEKMVIASKAKKCTYSALSPQIMSLNIRLKKYIVENFADRESYPKLEKSRQRTVFGLFMHNYTFSCNEIFNF